MKRWNKNMLETIFLPHEVETIKEILLSSNLPVDKIMWTGNESGVFTMRSAYKEAMGSKNKEGGKSSNGDAARLWKAIWIMKLPNKLHGRLLKRYFLQILT
ncbi:uncharacterized mitochondrial protein AtMg00310-like [Fagus crenata]